MDSDKALRSLHAAAHVPPSEKVYADGVYWKAAEKLHFFLPLLKRVIARK